MTKICTKCKEEKTSEEFHRDSSEKDGYNNRCKECRYGLSDGQKEIIKNRHLRLVEIYKTCNKCGENKHIAEFHSCKGTKDGLSGKCKVCKQAYEKSPRREQELKNVQENTRKNGQKILCTKCKEYKWQTEFQVSKRRLSGYYCWCKECYSSYTQTSEKYKETHKKYRNIVVKEKINNDVCLKFRVRISSAISHCIKKNGGSKGGESCWKYLGYTPQQLRNHLESLFESWMNFENYGKCKIGVRTWQVDHKIPVSSFHYTTMDCEEFRQCWALSNLRPLDAIENIRKSNKLPDGVTLEDFDFPYFFNIKKSSTKFSQPKDFGKLLPSSQNFKFLDNTLAGKDLSTFQLQKVMESVTFRNHCRNHAPSPKK